jgi:hypothetical protein
LLTGDAINNLEPGPVVTNLVPKRKHIQRMQAKYRPDVWGGNPTGRILLFGVPFSGDFTRITGPAFQQNLAIFK